MVSMPEAACQNVDPHTPRLTCTASGRAEFSVVSQELQRSYRAANEALEVLNPLEDPSSDPEASSIYEEASLEEEGPLSTSSGTMQRRSDGNGLPEVAGGQEGGDKG